ncbi:two-component system, OmpR family, phosphate regulon response regulator PhoB [Noviherbaspirillum humi]|uniref:Two-component system, OmpR family, phosphate regulon response regulator PhoB n=1 Tax=Noviherbaspirillum humi TaxID=1688639 RepID=A0A239M5J9_9BURK|nr:response regulator [Noviherbaspirillum humi]SNT37995.1 two-component system, OmpR family, phosphate regulon response regulator PhoB [Noviherbaspirillum humi]
MVSDKTSVLIVEDEPAIAELVSFTVRGAGWEPILAANSAEGWQVLRDHSPQVVLLDWMLPDQSGLRLLSRLRSDPQMRQLPVIMLTAKSMEEDKIAGLDQGADDYITKPFSPRELVSRIRALMRRKSPEHGESPLAVGQLALDPRNCSVSFAGRMLEMGQAEYRLLKFLMAHPERAFSRGQLLDKVWGNHVAIEERTVDVHVLRLRKALKAAEGLIRTVRGVGYMLSERSGQ